LFRNVEFDFIAGSFLRVLCDLLFKTEIGTEGRKGREVGQTIAEQLVN
jgi:hypothetical protein